MTSVLTNQLVLTELPISGRPKYLTLYNYLVHASGNVRRAHHTVPAQYDFQEVIKTNKTGNSGLHSIVDKIPKGLLYGLASALVDCSTHRLKQIMLYCGSIWLKIRTVRHLWAVSHIKLFKNMSVGSAADNDQCKMKQYTRILQSNGLFSERNNNKHENIKTIVLPLDTNKLRAGY